MKMNKQLILVLAILIPVFIYAGNEPNGVFPEWGAVTMDELKMTECSFDKKADAMLILDLGQVYYKRGAEAYFGSGKFHITTAYYQRYKVFNERGTEHANKKISLSIGNNEYVKNVKGICYNLVNGQIVKTELKPDDVHATKASEAVRKVTWTIPAVKAGSVFEVQYERDQDVSYSLPRWYFTANIPTAKSSVTLGFVDAMVYYVDKHIMEDTLTETKVPFTSHIGVMLPSQGVEELLKGVARTYTAYNVKGYQDEPYVNSRANYTSWIGFQLAKFQWPLLINPQLVTSFDEFSHQLYASEDFEIGLASDPIPQKYWESVITPSMSTEDKVRIIYDYIRSNMSCDGRENLFPANNNFKTWKNRIGSRTEINMILISALSKKSIKAYPMLVGSRAASKVNQDFPMLSDYIGIDVLVALDDKHGIVLDASEKSLPFGEPAYDQLNTTGWVLQDRSKNFWYDIRDSKSSAEKVLIRGAVEENGAIHGTAELIYTNYLADRMLDLKNTGSGTALGEYLKKHLPNVVIESFSDTFQADKCYFSQKIKFSAQATTDNDGTIYLTVPTVFGPSTGTFINKERVAEVDFGFVNKQAVTIQLTLPASYVADSLFEPINMRTSDTSVAFSYQASLSDGTLSMQQKMDYFRTLYSVDSYPAFYEFQKKYYDLRQRPVVLKKKS